MGHSYYLRAEKTCYYLGKAIIGWMQVDWLE